MARCVHYVGMDLDTYQRARKVFGGPFVDFESAKRNAEMNVGMKMNWGNF